MAGCAISYLTTLRYQLDVGGAGFAKFNAGAEFYAGDAYRIIPVLEFAFARIGDIVNHHLPPLAVAAVAVAAAFWLLSAGTARLCRGHGDSAANAPRVGAPAPAVATVFMLALAVAIGAALLEQYPANQSRHSTYLGPAVFVFSGVALAAAIHGLGAILRLKRRSSLTAMTPARERPTLAITFGLAALRQRPARQSRDLTFLRPQVLVFDADALSGLANLIPSIGTAGRKRLALVLAIVAAAITIGASVSAIRQDSPYQAVQAADFFQRLDQLVHQDDIVYIPWTAKPEITFYGIYYQRQWPDNYIQGDYSCDVDYTMCIRDVYNIATLNEKEIGDVYVIFQHDLTSNLMRYDRRNTLESFEDFRDARSKRFPPLSVLRFPADGGLLDSVRQEWLAEYPLLTAGNPEAKAVFDVYYNDDRLTYYREPCAPADTAAHFFLNVFPAGSMNVLPSPQRQHGFENRGFDFSRQIGALLDNRCWVTVDLPDYDIARIQTGQYTDAGQIWEANIPILDKVRYVQTAAQQPTARALFNLHLDGATLLYAKSPCTTPDTAAPFFLHITPANPNVLPESQRQYGFDNRDFAFDPLGVRFDGKCFIEIPLPEYEMTGIYTGQYTNAGPIWAADIPILDKARYLQTAAREPTVRALFNLHLDGATLLYAKEPCAPADTTAQFFLHITPANPNILPEPQRQHGFDNRDFRFAPDGALFDGKCFIRIPLPDYDIASIHTGQYTNAGRIWEAEFAP